MWQYIIAIILIAITARIVSAVKYVQKVSVLNIMPKPSGWKFWVKGHLDNILQGRPYEELRFYFMPFIMDMVKNNEMPTLFLPGPLMFKRACIFMTDPVAVRECFSSKHMTELHKGPEYNLAKPLLGNGILASNEQVWQRQRKICDLGFVNSVIKSSVERAAAVTNLAAENLIKSKNSDGKIIINADVEVALIAADVMGQVIFGYNFDDVNGSKSSEAPLYQALKTVLHTFNQRISKPEFLPNRVYEKNLAIINKYVDEIVAAEKNNNKSEQSGTLLSQLIHGDYQGQKLTEDEIKDNIKTFMFAGQDTTSSALAWGLYYLALNPEIQKKARDEVDKVFGRDRNQPTTYEMVKNELVYINYIMKEVLRIRPSAAFTKETKKDITLPGSDGKSYYVPQGVILHFNPLFVQSNPKYWGEDASEFKPERWGNLDNESNLSLIYFPFSQGHRSCIGTSFAKAKFVTVIAKLLQSFEFKLTPETAKQPPRLGMDLTLFAESYTLELVERK